MKGSNKRFTRYLNSEYNDDYLEPVDDELLLKNANTLIQNASQHEEGLHNLPKSKLIPKQILLTMAKVRELNGILGQDAQNCINGLSSIEFIESRELTETFNSIYTKFETIPILFCSIMLRSRQAVSVWQINRLCPYKKGTTNMVVDTRSKALETKHHISLLLLAKITVEGDEIILNAKLLDDSQLLVKSRQEHQGQIVIRIYDIKSFYGVAIINPFKEVVTANHLWSRKIVIQFLTGEGQNGLEISLYKKNNKVYQQSEDNNHQEKPEKDVLLQRKVLKEYINPLNKDLSQFENIYKTPNDVIIIGDKWTSTIIALQKDELYAESFKCPTYNHLSLAGTNLFIFNYPKAEVKVCFDDFSAVTVQYNPYYSDKEVQELVKKSVKKEEIRNAVLDSFKGTAGHNQVSDYGMTIYDTPVKLINPHRLVNHDQPKEEDEGDGREEKENKSEEKMNKIRKTWKNGNNRNMNDEMKNGFLKEIRAEISLKIKEVRQFDKEYKEEQKRFQQLEMKGPEGVAKETLMLYKEIKTDKKRTEKKREKEKNKKNGSSLD